MKALISLRVMPGWSAPLLFAHTKDRFSCDEACIKVGCKSLVHSLRSGYYHLSCQYIFVIKMSSADYICIYTDALKKIISVEANTMNPDQTASFGSSLIRVHIVCNIGHQST